MDSFVRLWKTLNDDVAKARTSLRAENSPYNRRSLIRTVIAYVEGVTFGLKQVVLSMPRVTLTEAESVLLREEQYELTDKAQPRVRTAFLKLERNLRFAFSTYAKVRHCSFELPISEAPWAALLRTIAVRNRLTHPKAASDLEVSDHEIEASISAFEWLTSQNSRMQLDALTATMRHDGIPEKDIMQMLAIAPFQT